MDTHTANKTKIESIYVCPHDHSELHFDKSHLRSDSCEHLYEIVNGIPNFLSGQPVEDEPTRESLSKLNQIARERGWYNALVEVYGNESDVLRYVTSHSRSSFLDLLNIDDSKTVLEIGPGLGQFTSLITQKAKQVFCLEVVPEQAEFVFERCRQLKKMNFQVACGGDDCKLPYHDNSIDTVILNLVLEWCSTRNSKEDAIVGQKRMLSEIFRVIKPGGCFYLCTKNRFALHYLLGKKDEHSYDMRFGNALPRCLHRMLLRLRGHHRPQGLLHSYNKLRALLINAGYSGISSYWAAPEMRYPKHYVPTDVSAIKQARRNKNFLQGDMRSVKALMPLIPAHLVKHFTHGLTFVAYKPPK